MTDDKLTVLMVRDGKKKLAELEGSAAQNLHNSKQAFAEAMLALETIRVERLWVYAVDEDEVMIGDYKNPQFKRDYLYRFCRNHGISMSSVYYHLGTVRSELAIGWDEDTIKQVGVHEAAPLRRLVDVNAKTGEVKLPPPDVLDKLPPGETPLDRVRAKADEIFVNPPEPLSPADAIKSITVDVMDEEEVAVFESGEHDIWLTWSHNGDAWDGPIILKEQWVGMDSGAREWLVKKLSISTY